MSFLAFEGESAARFSKGFFSQRSQKDGWEDMVDGGLNFPLTRAANFDVEKGRTDRRFIDIIGIKSEFSALGLWLSSLSPQYAEDI